MEYRVLGDGSLILLESEDLGQTTDHLDVVVHRDRELAALIAER